MTQYLSAGSGQQERLAEFVGEARQATLPATGRPVSDPVVVYVERQVSNGDIDVWTVTLAVRMAKRAGAAEERQHYRVSVAVSAGRLRALTLPTAVEAPGRGYDLALGYPTSCSPDTPLAQVAAGFLQALLTGGGDIARYTTPDSGITALKPSPFTTTDTATVSADSTGCGASGGDSARVLAMVNPKIDGTAAPTLAYPLAMVRAAGQWQVRSVEAVPALRNPLTVVTDQQAAASGGAGTSASRAPSSAALPIPPATQN